MRYILDAKQMKNVDSYSIETIGIPSVVLMEKAAMSVADEIKDFDESALVAVVCGCGNNGADGLAIARILFQKGFKVDVILVMDDKKHSEEYELQLNIIKNMGINIYHNNLPKEYNIVVDAIFGIGLSRQVSKEISDIMDLINVSNAFKIAVDIPSGIDATTGKVCGNAIKADKTVSFGYAKIGMLLHPGKQYTGELVVKDIGFVENIEKNVFTLDEEDLRNIPKKAEYSNKGSYEKVLIIAGSKDISGAMLLSTMAAYKTGAAYVKVYTHKANEVIIKTAIPEAMVSVYEDFCENELEQLLSFAKIVLIGPGISTDDTAKSILSKVLESDKKLVIDADAINIIAKEPKMLINSNANVILTPHLLEASRLMDININEINDDIIGVANRISERFNAVCVLKDAYTIVANQDKKVYINEVGNGGMAKAGSGDVLAGIVTGLLSNGMDAFDAACYGVYLHSMAGLKAANELGTYAMKPTDVIDNIAKMNGE